MTARFPVVGIGASAGGVEALEAFFKAMPAENGMAFVVVTHLDPKHVSWLPDIIRRHTGMPTAAARDEEEVEPQRVYVLPPAMTMTIEEGRLRLREDSGNQRVRMPIDIFFASLAEDRGENAIGIVLSGSGADGTLGITAIKERGGLTLAQGGDHSEPRFKDMPESAAATGLVDLIAPVGEMPGRLLSYVRAAGEIETERVAAATKEIFTLLRARLGHDFSQYKEKTFARRVLRRMQVLQLTDIDAYVGRLRTDTEEITLLFRDLLIGVTNFFRDVEAFETLETDVIPKIFEGKDNDTEVRVWVPACSTGEEAYSIAILMRERIDKLQSVPKVQIFATDIDERSMAVARLGQYPASLLKAISAERLQKYFVADNQNFRVRKELRDLCVFSPHSVIRDPPFSRVDLISCRNLLIYLKAELQARILPIFHYALRPEGFLFLGQSETVARHGDLFSPVDKHHRIFKRRELVMPLSNSLLQFTPPGGKALPMPRSLRELGALDTKLLRLANTAVMERFAPAHVVVNDTAEVLHYSIRTGTYLEPAFGAPTRDLFAMARKGLRPDLRTALRKAIETRRTVLVSNLKVETAGGGSQIIDLTVQPITEAGEAVFLIIFADVGPVRSSVETASDAEFPAADDTALHQAEKDLQETKQRLQATIEELETSNEELTSSNEELLSVNEELQSANEELEASKEETQSINEELQTVNAELHGKVTELDRSSGDLRNIFESTQIGTIFLDHNLVIRSFTSAATEVYGLVPGDRGRPLQDLVCRLDDHDVERDVREVLRKQSPIERRVSANKGAAHYLMRILPYRGADRKIDGALITFANITSVVAQESQQKVLAEELSHRVKNTLTVVAAMANQTAARAPTLEAFLDTFLGRLHSLASTHDLLFQSGWADASLQDLVKLELSPYKRTDGARLEVDGPPISLRPRAALTLGMVIHELATNSVKYGALSVPEGRLQVNWDLEDGGVARSVKLHWVEREGPKTMSPIKRGFGTELIERAISFELGGKAEIVFEKGGLYCTIRVPLGADIKALPQPTTSVVDHGRA